MMRTGETVVTRVDISADATVTGQSCLVVFYGQAIGSRYFLDRPELVIGRSDNANIQVDQDSVSRHHAKITTSLTLPPRICDLDSTNGTFVNNVRVAEAILGDGDIVRVGQTIFKHLSGSNIENKYHEEIYRLTTIDGLTETFNKRYFIEALEREMGRAGRYSRGLSLVMFDIDHFKRVNDSLGHLAGDHVLRELARLVEKNLRRQDVLARYGGEEFAIILPEVDASGAGVVCEKPRAIVEESPFLYNGTPVKITISLGIEAYAGDQKSYEQLIAAADARLYEAKQGGRNRVVV